MKNVDIETFPGSVKVGKKPSIDSNPSISSTFTVDDATDLFTSAVSIDSLTTNDAVNFTTTGVLPAPLGTSTNYFISEQSSTTFKVGTSIANITSGAYTNITDTGTGTHTFATVNMGNVMHIVYDRRSTIYFAQDSNARVWYNQTGKFYLLNGNTLTSGVGNGLALLLNSDGSATYLFAFRNATIDVVNVFGTSNVEAPSWSNGWQALNSTAGSDNPHHAIYAQDAIIYFTDDRFVGSIRENSGQVFNPATGATYTYTNQALDMPKGEITGWLAEQGKNLLIAGRSYNRIYPWDRVSSSFNLPLLVPEQGVYRMQNIGNIVYVLAGTRGNVYSTQGTYVQLVRKLPEYLINDGTSILTNPAVWGGIAQRNGALLFGVQSSTTGNNSGVYMMYPDGRLVIDAVPVSGTTRVEAIYADNEIYKYGYTGAIASFSGGRYSSFEGVVESALYRVATKTLKTTYSELEIQLAQPISGGHVRVSYGTSTGGNFTTLDTYTTDGTNVSYKTDAGIIDVEDIQVKVEMDGNIELMEVRLIP